ncbi:DNZ54_00345 family protein [Salmonella sp. WGH-01]|nr:DNZ54_00345 family protein [Salmonella sp. WGH-01]
MGCAVGNQPAVSAQRCAGSGWCVCPVSCFLARLLAALCAVGWFAGDRARDEVRAALIKFRAHPVKPVRTWAIRLLIVLCPAFSGWVITRCFTC